MSSLYKGKYFLALYDQRDHIVGTFDNVNELASTLGLNRQTVAMAICHFFAKRTKAFDFRGTKTNLYKIPADDHEEENENGRN